jgi:hypothetical protein
MSTKLKSHWAIYEAELIELSLTQVQALGPNWTLRVQQWRRSRGGRGGKWCPPLEFLRGGGAPPQKRGQPPLSFLSVWNFRFATPPGCEVWPEPETQSYMPPGTWTKWPAPPQFIEGGLSPPQFYTSPPPLKCNGYAAPGVLEPVLQSDVTAWLIWLAIYMINIGKSKCLK